MASMTEITCKCGCGRKKLVRTADVARGWGKFFGKSYKAKYQEKLTGQFKNYLGSGVDRNTFRHYANEYGGTPQFDANGDYEGFSGHFSNED